MVIYELKKDKVLCNGHTMFLEDVVKDLKRLDYLEKSLNEERAKLTESRRKNKALLTEHKRILDLTFEV